MMCNVKFVKGKIPQCDEDCSTFWEWYFPSNLAYISEDYIMELGFESNLLHDYFHKWITNIHPEDLDSVLSNLIWYLKEKAPYYKCEYRIKKNDKEYIWILSQGKALWNSNGRIIKMSGSHTDITSRKCMQENLRYLSEHDPETGLPLVPLFQKKLSKEANTISPYFAVLYLNISAHTLDKSNNRTENIHSLLMKVIKNINTHLTARDLLCRVGENEYILLLGGIYSKTTIKRKVNQLLNYYRIPFLIHNEIYSVAINIGITICPEDGRKAKGLIDNSRLAMYNSKVLGPNNYCFYNSIIYTNYTIIL